MSRPSRDAVRVVATLAGAVGQVVLPSVLLPRFRREEEPPNVMQPAPYAFGIWFPIFATSLAEAAVQARPSQREDPVLRAVGTPFALAMLSTAVWAPLVATRRYWAAQAALGGIALFGEQARRRLAAAEGRGDLTAARKGLLVPPVSMLAGWGAAATVVNLAAMLVAAGVVRPGRHAAATGVVCTLAVGGVATFATASTGGASSRTAQAYGATVLWALAGIVAGQRRSSPAVAVAAVVAAGPVLAALVPRQGSKAPMASSPSRTPRTPTTQAVAPEVRFVSQASRRASRGSRRRPPASRTTSSPRAGRSITTT